MAKIGEPIVAKTGTKAKTDELHYGQDQDEGRDWWASKFFLKKIIIFVTLSTVRLPNPGNEEQYLEIKIWSTEMNIKPTNLQPRKKQQHRDETTNPLKWTTYI